MDPTAAKAKRLEALLSLGFRRTDATPIPAEVAPAGRGRVRVSASRPSMGTLVAITALHPSRDRAEDAVGRAFQEMDRVVRLLDRYDGRSAISALNGSGLLRGPPPELASVMGAALACSRLTTGAFDPTVQPLVDRFRAARAALRSAPLAAGGAPEAEVGMPGPAELREILERVDARAVEMKPRSIRFRKSGMGVTLDGIAKGYVVDRMVDALRTAGLEDFLVNAGGDIRAAGHREDGRPWRVGIQDPGKTGAFPDVVSLDGGAVATSGSYEIHLDPDRVHHHIVDAGDGGSPRHAASVSVVAPTAMEADALATAVFLMEPRTGAVFIDSLPHCACLIVDRLGRQVRSAGWRSAGDPPTHEAGTSWQA